MMRSSISKTRPDRRRRGMISLEYIALTTFILIALFVFQKYLVRGISGGWKRAGDAFGFGRQFDPRPPDQGGTSKCYKSNLLGGWVDLECFKSRNCDCTLPREDPDFLERCRRCSRLCIARCEGTEHCYHVETPFGDAWVDLECYELHNCCTAPGNPNPFIDDDDPQFGCAQCVMMCRPQCHDGRDLPSGWLLDDFSN